MISAVDTNILLDVFTNDPGRCPDSARMLRECIGKGQVVVSDVVWAELAAAFPDDAALRSAMSTLGIEFLPLERAAASLAGRYWRQYREREGDRRSVVADFLIGAHALLQAEQLLTRDRGFYRDYFTELKILSP